MRLIRLCLVAGIDLALILQPHQPLDTQSLVSQRAYLLSLPDIILHDPFQSLKLRAHILTCPNRRNSLRQTPRSIRISEEAIGDCIDAFLLAAFLELYGVGTVTKHPSRQREKEGGTHRLVSVMVVSALVEALTAGLALDRGGRLGFGAAEAGEVVEALGIGDLWLICCWGGLSTGRGSEVYRSASSPREAACSALLSCDSIDDRVGTAILHGLTG